MDIQTASMVVGILIGLGTLIAGIGFAYAQFKSGGDKYKDNLIDTLKESVAILEDKNKKQSEERTLLINSHQSQLTQMAKEIGELRGQLHVYQEKSRDYKEILQGRDPEQTALLKEIRELLKYFKSNRPRKIWAKK